METDVFVHGTLTFPRHLKDTEMLVVYSSVHHSVIKLLFNLLALGISEFVVAVITECSMFFYDSSLRLSFTLTVRCSNDEWPCTMPKLTE